MKRKKSSVAGLGSVLALMMLPISLQAQTLYTTSGDQLISGGSGSSTVRPNLEVDGTGGAVFKGTFGQGSIPKEGDGARMMWYPGKAAFRVGGVSGHYWNTSDGWWDEEFIGNYSVGFGYNSTAKGAYSVAMGNNSVAEGEGAVALGNGHARGFYGVAIGFEAGALGDYSVGIGYGQAMRDYSIAIGCGASAYGEGAVALGYAVQTQAFCSTVLGVANVDDNSQSQYVWQPGSDLLVVGNGEIDDEQGWAVSYSNALVMRKNANMRTGGKIEAKGVIRCAPGGDLSMGAFTEGQDPRTLNNALKYSGE